MQGRPRLPGFTYLALSVLLLILLAALALTARQPPPPTIAEFAPQAVENITESPEDQSSSRGAGAGNGPGGSLTDEAPTPSASPIEVPRVRKCVGDPPRQIEDPQSPPCVPYWVGDNGGATYKGVTASTIRIAVPGWDDDVGNSLMAFFNKRFELYGRRLDLFEVPDSSADDDPETARAEATNVDEEQKAFASVGNSFDYHAELARRHLVSATQFINYGFDDKLMAKQRPYLWQYPMAANQIFSAMGAWVCARLAGGTAEYADGTERGQPRKFGVVLQYQVTAQEFEMTALRERLDACGAAPVKTFSYPLNGTDPDETSMVLQMREAGVTSVICLCHVYGASIGLTSGATAQAYFPEWLISSYGDLDYDFFPKQFPQEQWSNAFGISMIPKQVQMDDHPMMWAMREAKPDVIPPSTGPQMAIYVGLYRAVLLLASGIQMAGPNLTAATFERGLHRTRFPNPDHPNQAGKVGFENEDHSMTNDLAEIWWDSGAQSPYADGPGAYCYVDGGARRDPRAVPSGRTSFFAPPCQTA